MGDSVGTAVDNTGQEVGGRMGQCGDSMVTDWKQRGDGMDTVETVRLTLKSVTVAL